MNETQELLFAHIMLEKAHMMAYITCADPGDVDAATAAIISRALELATPELSAHGRAMIFDGDENG